MSITYVIHDVAFDGEGSEPAIGLDPATKAALRMQGVGEIGAVMLVPCAGSPLLVTTGYGQSRPDLAYPLFWIKRSLYLRGTENVTRIEWEPVTGLAHPATLPGGYDMESPDQSLHCLDVELCQVLMMLTIECGRRALNAALPAQTIDWYRKAQQRPAPDLSGPVFDAEGNAATDLWTRRAAESYRRMRQAAPGGR